MIKTNYRTSVYVPVKLVQKIADIELQMVMPISTLIRTTVAQEINLVHGKLQQHLPLQRGGVTKERSYRSRKDVVRIEIVLPAVYRDRFNACYAFHQERFVASVAKEVTNYITNFKLCKFQ